MDHFNCIKDAINASNSDDTIYVRNGTYFEKICINKSISLIGENNRNTSIIGDFKGSVVTIMANDTNVSGFTIKNSDKINLDESVIRVNSDNNIIFNNIISSDDIVLQNKIGISLPVDSDDNLVINNKIYYSNRGIDIESSNNTIINNSIRDCCFESIIIHSINNKELACDNSVLDNVIYESNIIMKGYGYGIQLYYSPNNLIEGNIIRNKFGGILLEYYSDENKIFRNSIYKNRGYGIGVSSSNCNISINNIYYNEYHGINFINYPTHNNTVYHNNIYENSLNCYARRCFDIHMVENYYSDWIGLRFKKLSFLPYCMQKGTRLNGRIKIPRFSFSNFDWHPSSEPFKID